MVANTQQPPPSVAQKRDEAYEQARRIRARAEKERAAVTNSSYIVDGAAGVGRFIPADRFEGVTNRPLTLFDLIRESEVRQNKLSFDPYNCIIARNTVDYLNDDKLLHRTLSKKSEEYDVIKQNTNLVALTVKSHLLASGSVNKGDPRIKMLDDIGSDIGHILKWEARRQFVWDIITFPVRLVTGKVPQKISLAEKRFGDYADPSGGAAKLYKKLLDKQNGFSLFKPASWFGMKGKARQWNLPELEQSFFDHETVQTVRTIDRIELEQGRNKPGDFLTAEGMMLEKTATELGHVRDIKPHNVERSVRLGHHILDNLKKMKFEGKGYAIDSPETQKRDLDEANNFVKLASAYEDILAGLGEAHPEALSNPLLEEARLAFGKLGHMTLLNALHAYADDPNAGDKIHDLEQAIEGLPVEYQFIKGETVEKLLMKIEMAMDFAVRKQGLQEKREKRTEKAKEIAAQLVAQDDASLNHTIAMNAELLATTPNLITEYSREITRENNEVKAAAAKGNNTLSVAHKNANIVSHSEQELSPLSVAYGAPSIPARNAQNSKGQSRSA